jgi:hypothetical protein
MDKKLNMSLWNIRDKALKELDKVLKNEAEMLREGFSLLDECIARLETEHASEPYARVCALSLIKARNLLLGSYSLSIDGLAQEAGALLRPFIEAFEKMVYFNEDRSRIEEAIEDRLPSAGEIAKRIQGQFKTLREHLNQHSSHFGLTYESARHLIDWNTLKFMTVQPYSRKVLRANLKTIFTFLVFLNVQAIECLYNLGDKSANEIADRCDSCKTKGFELFDESVA